MYNGFDLLLEVPDNLFSSARDLNNSYKLKPNRFYQKTSCLCNEWLSAYSKVAKNEM